MTRKDHLDGDSVLAQASGHWLELFEDLCPGTFTDAIRNMGRHVTCPFHGGKNDFRFIGRSTHARGNTAQSGVAVCTCGVCGDGATVIRKATGWSYPETLTKIDTWLNGGAVPVAPVVAPARAAVDAQEVERRKQALSMVINLWGSGKNLDVQRIPYYLERGISAPVLEEVQDTRYLASLGYYDLVEGVSTKIGSYPALLALMRDSAGNPVAVHRTWLSKDGREKAPVASPKKLTATPGVQGAAIRLYDASGATVLGITEGIETAHAARQLAITGYWPDLEKLPVWACFAERNIRSFVVPDAIRASLKKVIVFADNDENGKGLEAANAFKTSMAQTNPTLAVVIRMPEVVGQDWNDVLVNL